MLCSLAATACTGSEAEPPQSADLLLSCVTTSNMGTEMSVQRLVGFLEAQGATVTFDSVSDQHILTSVTYDPLTEEARRMELEVSLQQTARPGGGPAACGPHRAEVTQVVTPAGVLQNAEVDTAIAQLAQDVAR